MKGAAWGIVIIFVWAFLYGVAVEIFGHGTVPFLVLVVGGFVFLKVTGLWRWWKTRQNKNRP